MDEVKLQLRLSLELHERLVQAARAANRSLNAELNHRLQESLDSMVSEADMREALNMLRGDIAELKKRLPSTPREELGESMERASVPDFIKLPHHGGGGAVLIDTKTLLNVPIIVRGKLHMLRRQEEGDALEAVEVTPDIETGIPELDELKAADRRRALQRFIRNLGKPVLPQEEREPVAASRGASTPRKKKR